MLKYIVFYLFCLFIGNESAKILGVFPAPSISHQIVFRPVMLELAKRGHEVTVITPDPAYPKGQTPANYTEIDLHDISYEHWHQFAAQYEKMKNEKAFIGWFSGILLELVEKQLKSVEIKNFLRTNKTFDLLFVESLIRPALIFSHIFNAPVIEFSSGSAIFSAFEKVGAASHPFIYPNVLHRRIYNLTLWEKITKLYIHYSSDYIYEQHIHVENEKLKSILGPDIPGLNDLRKNVQMLFLNVHSLWDLNRPVPPNLVYLGGLHQKPHHDLPQELKSYLDSSKHGVIYISFGTNVKPSMFPLDKVKIFTDVLSQLPYNVLWKWDKDELPGRSKNVRISKWLPQSDMLKHPKIKLFITQGGLQSTDEAITAGVPLVGMPMLGDQWFNVEQYVKLGIGKGLLLETLTEDQLMDAINTVIDDESYRQNIVKIRNILNDQPQRPLERAVWWTEYVLRHGTAKHLHVPAAHLQWTEYYELELVLYLLAAFVLILSGTILALYIIISKVRCYTLVKVKNN